MTLPFPAAALKQHGVILGKTGAGKSSAMRVIVEQVLDENIGHRNPTPVCIVDPKGDWWGLKTSRDGKQPGYPLAIFGGEHADMPLTPRAGTALAEVVVNAPFPCLIDLGGWMISERTRFFIDFSSRYFKLARGRRFLFMDEVHNFVPKGKIPDPEVGKMLHWGNRLASEGRGKGITLIAASQRPQKVHNDFLTSMETLVAMRVIHKADRNAYKDWIEGAGDMALGKEVLETVADLKRGSAWIWSPEIGFGPKVVEFPLFKTYDSFKPQVIGAKELAGRADVDLEQVKQQFAAFVQEAEQNDPKALRKRIADLETEIRKLAKHHPVVVVGQIEEARYKERERARDYLSKALGAIDTLRADVSNAYAAYNVDRLNNSPIPPPPKQLADDLARVSAKPIEYAIEVHPTAHAKPLPWTTTKDDADGTTVRKNPTGLRLKILGALLWFEERGMKPTPRAALGGVADFTPDKGYGARTLGEMKTEGLLTYPTPGMIELTQEGRILAPEPPSYATLYEAWEAATSGLHREILSYLRSHHPRGQRREELGQALGKTFDKGYGARVLGELKTMGAIYYPGPGILALTTHVMP